MSWGLELYTGSNCWISQTNIPNPGLKIFTDSRKSTTVKQKLFDGSTSYLEPEKTYEFGPIELNWPIRETTVLKNRFENYLKSGSGLRITTHTGRKYIVKISEVDEEWRLVGEGSRKWNLKILLERYDENALRDQQW